MEGMAKSAPSKEPLVVKHDSKTSSVGQMSQSIHPEFYNFFSISPSDSSGDQLKTVADWAMKDNTPGLALKKIRSLEIKLGIPTPGETKLSKMYNYVRLTDKLINKETELKETLDNSRARHLATIKSLTETHRNKIDKIDAELKKAKIEYSKARAVYNRTATNKSEKIRGQFAQQLNELKAMREAYKGGK